MLLLIKTMSFKLEIRRDKDFWHKTEVHSKKSKFSVQLVRFSYFEDCFLIILKLAQLFFVLRFNQHSKCYLRIKFQHIPHQFLQKTMEQRRDTCRLGRNWWVRFQFWSIWDILFLNSPIFNNVLYLGFQKKVSMSKWESKIIRRVLQNDQAKVVFSIFDLLNIINPVNKVL